MEVGAAHAAAPAAVLAALGSGAAGLTEAEAAERLAAAGPNTLPAGKRRGPLARLVGQFANLLILIMLAAACVTALMGHWVDTAVILAVVGLNTVIGFLQEGRAERALESIGAMLSAEALVVRGGVRRKVEARDLAPGDVVALQAGDRVPADLRLIRARNLRVEEAALTGESVAVAKGEAPVAAEAPLGDRSSMAFSGTMVSNGTGEGVVTATGARTEIGRISTLVSEVRVLTTPLLAQMEHFARTLSLVILGAAVLIFLFGYAFRDMDVAELFMAVVALFVAAIPEGLPAILTVTLAIGVQRMAARHAVVRRLPAVETLGSVGVICSDKTGTLTRNEMVVTRLSAPGVGRVTVSGEGYAPEGGFAGPDGAPVDPAGFADLLRVAGHCNDSGLERDPGGGWRALGDPMEAALLALAGKGGAPAAPERRDEIPFDSDHAFMAVLQEGTILLKGAPERVLERCRDQAGPDGPGPLDLDHWRAEIDAIAAKGARVLGAAELRVPPGKTDLDFDDVAEGLTFLGLYGLYDPPRTEAIAAVAECRAAGISVKMITGDHAATARAIAAELGLERTDHPLTGADLDGLDEAGLRAAVLETDVFARTTPEHKLRLVEALQSHGLSVAMTGDGVNDAPALKRADIGIAMGHKGTEAAREAAQMVLTDDNFASITAAVREGRVVYDNLRKAITFLLPTNGGESGALVLALLAGVTMPITALQILWINMVSSIALALPLAFEPAEPGVMERPPRPSGRPLLTRFVIWRVGLVSVLFLTGIFGMFLAAQARGLSVEESRTIAVNTLVMMEVFYIFTVRFLHGGSLTWRGLMGTPAILISIALVVCAQLVFTFAPFMHALFGSAPVTPGWAAAIFCVGVSVFFLVEFDKWAARFWRRRRLRKG